VRHSSSFTGVTFSAAKRKWHVKTTLNGKDIFLGYFEHEADAARAYDNWAKDFPDRSLNFRE
jgi:hypothetical protein